MPMNFKKYVQKAEEFINEVAVELGDPSDKAKAGRILRAVLHALREQITPTESMQLIAQLPVLIKSIYIDGWKLGNKAHRVHKVNDFIEVVREFGKSGTSSDFSTDMEVKQAVHAVITVIKNHTSEGEIADIIAVLPTDLKPLVAEA